MKLSDSLHEAVTGLGRAVEGLEAMEARLEGVCDRVALIPVPGDVRAEQSTARLLHLTKELTNLHWRLMQNDRVWAWAVADGASQSRVRETWRAREIHFKRWEDYGQVVSNFYRELHDGGFEVQEGCRVARLPDAVRAALSSGPAKIDDQ